MKALTPNLNLNDELAAVAAFLRLKWAPIANLEQLLERIRAVAVAKARRWVDDTVVGHHARSLYLNRILALKEQNLHESWEHSYDATRHYLSELWLKSKELTTCARDLDGQWDYSKELKLLLAELTQEFPGLIDAAPLGYQESVAAYAATRSFTGDYDRKADEDLFEGSKAEGVLSGDLLERINLPYVTYMTKGYGETTAEILVGAVFSHFLIIKAYLNGVDVCKAIDTLMPAVDGPLTFEMGLETDNWMLSALCESITPPPGEQSYKKELRALTQYALLTPKEKEARRIETDAWVSSMIDEIKSRDDVDPFGDRLKKNLRKHVD